MVLGRRHRCFSHIENESIAVPRVEADWANGHTVLAGLEVHPFVGKVFRLALLAPDIVDAILDGKQPAHVTLAQLMKPFPVEWEGQKQKFDIAM